MPSDILELLPLFMRALEGALSAFWAMALTQMKPMERIGRALALCAVFGAVFAAIPQEGWGLALTGLLFLLLGAALWLLVRSHVLYTAVAAFLAALIAGTLELLRAVMGPVVLLAAFLLLAVCCWRKIVILPDTLEVLAVTDQQQTRKFFSSTAMVLTALLLPTFWVWYQVSIVKHTPTPEYRMLTLFTAAIALVILIILRRLAFDAVLRVETLIDKKYQAELLNLMQVIRSQRHDFNFHIQAISGMIEQGKYSECDDYVRMMVKTASAMNDMLPLHNPAVSAMISSFREIAVQKGIEFQIAISNDLEQIPCTIYEINTVIGNLLQNAIDELERDKKLRPWINILILKRGGNHIIKITNPCSQEADTFRNCFRPGFTTKQSHEGIGLATVLRIVSKYHGTVFPEFDDGVVSFVAQFPGVFG